MGQISHHAVELIAEEELHALGEMPGVLPPFLLRQGISFGICFLLGVGFIEDAPELFLEQQDLLYDGAGIDLHYLGDEEMILGTPSIHVL